MLSKRLRVDIPVRARQEVTNGGIAPPENTRSSLVTPEHGWLIEPRTNFFKHITKYSALTDAELDSLDLENLTRPKTGYCVTSKSEGRRFCPLVNVPGDDRFFFVRRRVILRPTPRPAADMGLWVHK